MGCSRGGNDGLLWLHRLLVAPSSPHPFFILPFFPLLLQKEARAHYIVFYYPSSVSRPHRIAPRSCQHRMPRTFATSL